MNIISFLKRALSLTKTREDLRFVMYTRRSCQLCELAWQELLKAQEKYRFVLEQRDVDADPELTAQYGDCVPVVTVNDKVRFRGSVNPVLLQRLLEAPVGSGSESGSES